MTREEALAAAEQIVGRGRFTHADTAELATLERDFPGVGAEAAEEVVDPSALAADDSSVCEAVDYWANLRWSRNEIVRPDALLGLVEVLRTASATGRSLRMVGAARSDSLVSTPDDDTTLIASCALDEPLAVLTDALADGVDAKTLYRCESGRQAKDVIDDLQSAGLALANMGSGQFQGIVGAIMTATHGSGLKLPDMSGQTEALQLVTFDDAGQVVVRQIARPGLFDPAKFAEAVKDSPVPVELVEDADAFLANVVGLGMLGLVYSVTLLGVPQYWLHETRLPARWSELKKVLLDEAAEYRNYEVLVSPHATEMEGADGEKMLDHECLVTRRALVDATEPSGKRPLSMHLASTVIGHDVAGATLVAATRHPLGVVPWMLHTGVTSTKVEGYTDVSRKVLQLNLDLNAVASELEIPVEKTVEAVDQLLGFAKESWAAMEERLGDHPDPVQTAFEPLKKAWMEVPLHTSPISLRFVTEADAMLSMAYGGTRCMIEMPMPGSTHLDEAVKRGSDVFEPRELELYEAYLKGRDHLYRTTEQALRESVGARPHWGLVNSITAEQAEASYPRWTDWMSFYAVANQHGVFNGPMTEQLGISVKPPRRDMPGDSIVGEAVWVAEAGQLVLLDALATHLFDALSSEDQRRRLCGKDRSDGSLAATTAGLGKPRACLSVTGTGLAPAPERVPRPKGDTRGVAALGAGVLQIDGAAGKALRTLLREGGAPLADEPELPVRFHVLDLPTGRLDLLADA